LKKHGKCSVSTLMLNGELSGLAKPAEEMAREYTVDEAIKGVEVVEGSEHYIAEENPKSFVGKWLDFVSRVEA
jgi:hypothetical protein